MASTTASPSDRSLPFQDIRNAFRPFEGSGHPSDQSPGHGPATHGSVAHGSTGHEGTDGPIPREPNAADGSGAPRSPHRSLPRTFALIGLLGTLLVVAVLGLVAHGEWRRTVQTGEAATARAAFFLAEHAARLFDASDLALERAKALVAGRRWDAVAADRSVHDQLVQLRDDLPYVDDLWLNDAEGRIRQTSFVFPPPEGNASGRTAFRAHADGDLGDALFAAEPIVGSVTGRPSLLASRRIAGSDGAFGGVALATLSNDYFTDLWQRAPLPDGGRAALFHGGDGTVLSRWPEAPDGRTEGMPADLRSAIRAIPAGGTYRDREREAERIGGYAKVGDLPLYVRVSLARSDLLAAWWQELRRSVLFAGLALAGLGTLALFAAHQVRRAERDRRALRSEVARRTADLRAEAKMLETVNRASRSLSEKLDREEAVQRVVDLGTSLIGAEFGAFFYDGAEGEDSETDPERIGLYALSGAPRSAFEDFGHPRKTALFHPTVADGEAVRVEDVATDPRYGTMGPHHGMPAGHLPVRSYLAVPVSSRDGTAHGALLFGHREPGRFTERHEALVRGIAAQAAVVMDNAALFAGAQDEIERRRQSEERQQLLIRELHHRVKNTLATVRAIASISSRTAPDMESFTHGFTDRIQALGQTHTLLIEGAWENVAVRDLVLNELDPYRSEDDGEDGDGARVVLEGLELRVPADKAVPLGMAIHELTTNAVKYGALSVPAGRVTVRWVSEGGIVVLDWIESGGPSVAPPTRRGFGSTLLERVLSAQLGASVEADFAPDGLRYRITFAFNEADGIAGDDIKDDTKEPARPAEVAA